MRQHTSGYMRRVGDGLLPVITHATGVGMGFLSKLTKSAVAKKAVDEARKPENQRKLKDLAAKKTRGKGGKA